MDERFRDLCGPFIPVVPVPLVAPVVPPTVASVVVVAAPRVPAPVVVVEEAGSVVESWRSQLADLGEGGWKTSSEMLRIPVDSWEEDELRCSGHPSVHHEGCH